jgi:hypothetical protein
MMPRKKKTTTRTAVKQVTEMQTHEEPAVEARLPQQMSRAEQMMRAIISTPGLTAKQKQSIAKKIQEGSDLTGIGLDEPTIAKLEKIVEKFS